MRRVYTGERNVQKPYSYEDDLLIYSTKSFFLKMILCDGKPYFLPAKNLILKS